METRGIQGSVGAKGDRGERGERGVKGEKGIQSDNSNVLVYWLIIYRFNWRLGMVKKCALSSTVYQRIGRVS